MATHNWWDEVWNPVVYWISHAAPGVTVIASLAGFIPPAAALLGAIWYSIQILESHTVQHWLANRRMIWKARKVARLRSKERVILAELGGLKVVKEAKRKAWEAVEKAQQEAEEVTQIELSKSDLSNDMLGDTKHGDESV